MKKLLFAITIAVLGLVSCTKPAPALFVPDAPTKIDQLLYLLREAYVDSLSVDSIQEIAMTEVVKQLDPHSAYIPAKDLEMVNSELSGSFSGIGVQFSIQEDTVCVIAVISGGPSEHIGLIAGDKIVEVDDSVFVGKSITNEKVMHHLRGEKGTKVRLGIVRQGTAEMLHYEVTRGDIPVKSVDAQFVVDGTSIGFISVNKFGDTTYKEFISALANLRRQGADRYIIDLRQNSGGYMEQAIRMANEFLEDDQMIVYAEGRAYPRYEARANGGGRFQRERVAVLIDDFSASASEIFAGAMQDNHRATIIGRRSFGKGLVQQQLPFADGSAIRLTVARYYTPSGRCVQKPYKLGEQEDYDLDLLERYDRGEFFAKDSIKMDGGIMPDIFVGRDTSYSTPYANRIINHAYTYQFAFQYTDRHRAELKVYKDWCALERHLQEQNLLDELVAFAASKGIEKNEAQLAKSKQQLLRLVHAYIVRDILGDEGFFPLYERDDEITKKAVEVLSTAN